MGRIIPYMKWIKKKHGLKPPSSSPWYQHIPRKNHGKSLHHPSRHGFLQIHLEELSDSKFQRPVLGTEGYRRGHQKIAMRVAGSDSNGKTLPGGVNCLLFLMEWLDVTTEWFVWNKICKQWDEHLSLWDAWELEGKKNWPFYQTADFLMDGLPLLYGWSTMWKIDQCPHVSSFAHRNLGLESETLWFCTYFGFITDQYIHNYGNWVL